MIEDAVSLVPAASTRRHEQAMRGEALRPPVSAMGRAADFFLCR